APIDGGIGEGLAEAQWDVDPAVLVLAAGFEQHHPGPRVLAQPRRHRAARRPGADNDEISLDHLLRPFRPILLRCHFVPSPNRCDSYISSLAPDERNPARSPPPHPAPGGGSPGHRQTWSGPRTYQDHLTDGIAAYYVIYIISIVIFIMLC